MNEFCNQGNHQVLEEENPVKCHPHVQFPIKVECKPQIVTYPSGKTYARTATRIMRVPCDTTMGELQQWMIWENNQPQEEKIRIEGKNGRSYTLTKNNTTGKISCTCYGHRYYRKCKHTQSIT